MSGVFQNLPAMFEVADHKVATACFQAVANLLVWFLTCTDTFPEVVLHDCLPQVYAFPMLILTSLCVRVVCSWG